MKKLSVFLGLREKLEKDFGNMLTDMLNKFKNKQGLFQGFRHTFEPLDGFADEPDKRKFQNVSSTVDEQLNWFKQHTGDYLTTVLSIEKTNAQSVTADLIVDGNNWGTYTTLELLRLKGILDSKLKAMVQDLPIRPETQIWKESLQNEFKDRHIWETPMDSGSTKTTIKDTIIVNDPHIKDSAHARPPVTRETSIQVNTGKYTTQNFSGAITNRERAELEVRYNDILKGVIAALEAANNVEVVQSDLGTKVLDYLF
jgi:hypothetical protein